MGIESDICLKWVNSPKFASKLKENLQMTPKSCCAHVPISFNAIKTGGIGTKLVQIRIQQMGHYKRQDKR